ncbi:MAG: hypothetical protein IJT68_05210 [Lentisphaeria bacterium]|nr:hypothetical protein [Lentisphaeria bacterium]MBR3505527.1 hypothetical protein [Lentisphaeria bacterium]
MKRICFLLFFAMTAVLSAAAKPAATPATTPSATKPAATAAAKPAEATAKPAEAVLTRIYSTNRDPAEFADPEKAESLLKNRAGLVQDIQNERKRLLKEDAAAKKLHEEIMDLNRRLASLLENKPTMINLNSKLREVDDAISRLKPAPAPETEAAPGDTKKEDAGKAGNADKTGKAGKE